MTALNTTLTRAERSFDMVHELIAVACPDGLQTILDQLEGTGKINARERGMIVKAWQCLHAGVTGDQFDAWLESLHALLESDLTHRETKFALWLDAIVEACYISECTLTL